LTRKRRNGWIRKTIEPMKYDFTLPVLELNEDGELIFTIWALTVTEFRGIYNADTRKDKKVAVAIMMYIALLEDYSMWGLKLPENKQLEYARRHCGIDRLKKDWVPHNSIRKARDRYKDLQGYVCTEMQMLFAVEKSIQNLTKSIVRISQGAEGIIKRAKNTYPDVTNVSDSIEELMTKTGKLSDKLDTVKKLQDQVSARRREEQIAKIRGGGAAGPRERAEDSLIVKQKDLEEPI